MQQSERPAFIKVLAGVHDFYGKELSGFAIDVWWHACKDCDLPSVSRAFSEHLMDATEGKWIPKPADLVRQLKGTRQDQSRLAWSKVLDAAQRVGAYSDVVFDDPIIHASVEDIGGWMQVCRTDYEELPHLERRFCESYRAYAMPGRLTRWPTRLVGEAGLSNRLRGQSLQKPALIGSPEKCEQVMKGGIDEPKTLITFKTPADALLKAIAQ